VWVEQAIFTSMTRNGRSGYHVVSRSRGVTESDANTLATWCPSHGALIVDAENRTSVNFHSLPGDRFALSRTCIGPPEFSGRGGRQLYTHALVFEIGVLRDSAFQPLSLYRDALALGHLRFRAEPPELLDPIDLSYVYRRPGSSAWLDRAKELNLPALEPSRAQLSIGQSVRIPYGGGRIALAECLLGLLSPEEVPSISFTTSLQPSAVRPCRLTLVGALSESGQRESA
jgi:hypothetical protein